VQGAFPQDIAGEEPEGPGVRRIELDGFVKVSPRQDRMVRDRGRDGREACAFCRAPVVEPGNVRRSHGIGRCFQVGRRQDLQHTRDILVGAAVKGVPEELVSLECGVLRVLVAVLVGASKTAIRFRFAHPARPIASTSALMTVTLVMRGLLTVPWSVLLMACVTIQFRAGIRLASGSSGTAEVAIANGTSRRAASIFARRTGACKRTQREHRHCSAVC
jgi:hypothetical protein